MLPVNLLIMVLLYSLCLHFPTLYLSIFPERDRDRAFEFMLGCFLEQDCAVISKDGTSAPSKDRKKSSIFIFVYKATVLHKILYFTNVWQLRVFTLVNIRLSSHLSNVTRHNHSSWRLMWPYSHIHIWRNYLFCWVLYINCVHAHKELIKKSALDIYF